MRRSVGLVLTLLLGGSLALTAYLRSNRVYTVPEVLAGLSHSPGTWAGRTALVWGTALELVPGCPGGQWCPSGLYKPHTQRPGPLLLQEPGPSAPMLARLRQLPLIRSLAPLPQHLRWQTPAVYQLAFESVPHTLCHALPCITAVLVDAA